MNLKKLPWLAAFMLGVACSFVMPAKAQTRTITGAVTDTADRALANVSVLVKGTTIGTQTKQDGTFSLHAPASAATLVFTSINYGSLEVPITGDVVNAHLTPIISSLADVVVIGYGTQQRKDVTGAISTVTTKDFQKGTITSPDQLIAGKVAGVSVTSNGGAPGAGSVIRIREGASLNASNDPLIIVDGIPLSPNGIAGASNQLALINPNDIETMTVLKDAASTAIYGSRASNGVIIITTKRGRRGKPQINFATNLSVSTLAKEIKVLNGDEMRAFVNNPANGATAAQKALLGTANTDWQKQIYQNALTSDNNLSISGAVKSLPYRVSMGFLTQQGTLKTDLLQRGTFSLNLTPMLFDNHLKIDVNLKGTLSKDRFANQSAIGSAIAFDPTQPVYNSKDSYYEWLQTGGTYNPNATANPVGLLNQYYSKGYVSRSFGNIQFDYKFHFLPDLHANLNLGYDVSDGHGNVLVDSSRQSNSSYSYRGTTSQYKQTTVNTVGEFYLNYVKDIKSIRSNINAVAGYGYYDNKPKTFNYYSYFLNSDTVPSSKPTYPTDIEQNTLISYYGRLIYTYANKYILSGSIRTDGSSRFAPGVRWGVFPSGAVTWRINQENFLKNVRAISDLKLRLSYGVTGQQEGIANYSYLPAYYMASATSQYQFGNTFYTPYTPAAYVSDIKWEQTDAYNAGIDIGLLKNRLSATVDVYTRKTTNLLNSLNLAAGTNFTNIITDNVGDMNSKGIEVTLNATPVQNKNFSWSFSYNFSYTERKITKLTKAKDSTFVGNLTGPGVDVQNTQVQINSVGYTPFAFYVYKQVYDANGKPIEGLYADLNRDGVVNSKDLYRYKSPFAPFKMGFSTSVSYKQWSLSTVLRASIGNYLYNQVFSSNGSTATIISPNNFIQNVPKASLDAGFATYQRQSDYYIYNASFLKMDNLGLSYNVGNIINKKARLALGAYCQNVFTVTKYPGIDPEVYSGVDNVIYPRPRIYTLSANLTF